LALTKKPSRPAKKASPRPALKAPRGLRAEAKKAKAAAEPGKKAASKRSRKVEKKQSLVQAPAAPLPKVEPSKQARETALFAAEAALDKKALNVEIIDVAGKVDYADLLVLMTGTSDRHVASIVHGIEEDLRKRGIKAIAVEGIEVALWVLVDFGDVVVHAFQEDAREQYNIGQLFRGADRIPVPTRAQEAPKSGQR
jgi:ribosome-associated protein